MKIESLRLVGLRSFQDTGRLELSQTCNIFVGPNNAGKSSILRGVLHWQGQGFGPADCREGERQIYLETTFSEFNPQQHVAQQGGLQPRFRAVRIFEGTYSHDDSELQVLQFPDDRPVFHSRRPHHLVVPFLARRKAPAFDQSVNLNAYVQVTGTYSNLYSLIDEVATAGHPDHERFKSALDEIVGLRVTTRASDNGKEAGIYLSKQKFVTLERMGDGVTEMVALIAALCVEEGKVFLLEEPESNLHPRALKGLLRMVREAQCKNQFLVATHSNVVLRELGADDTTKIFRVHRKDPDVRIPSSVVELRGESEARTELLRELGYEFADFGLHDAWLFLEESSAERVIRDVLVPRFVPNLRGRLRTFAAGGVTNVEPSVSEFRRLITFVHLQPVYDGSMWVRVDGDDSGSRVVQDLEAKFPTLKAGRVAAFSQPDFELYYPQVFEDTVRSILAMPRNEARRSAKTALLQQVLEWTQENEQAALQAWEVSAAEVINLLREIEARLSTA
jgi:predicted ATPase